MTVGPPRFMKKGGFSITSWPRLTMQSDASTARWTKSPADSAAQPRNLGCRSSITPLPSWVVRKGMPVFRSEEHTSELQSLMRISYAVFCLKKKNNTHKHHTQ